MSFPMSLRWTASFAPNPQRGLQKRLFFVFRIEMGFSRRKSTTKFLCVKTFSGKVVRHSLVDLTVHKWLVGDVRPLLPEILGQSEALLQKGDFQSIFARSAWTIAPSEKSSIITNRKSTIGFLMSLRWTAYVAPKPLPQRGNQKRKVTVCRIKVDLSCKRSMLLVFWHRQRLVQGIVWPTPSLTTHPKLTHAAARFLCDSWATCFSDKIRNQSQSLTQKTDDGSAQCTRLHLVNVVRSIATSNSY